jgi:hypothetical protein
LPDIDQAAWSGIPEWKKVFLRTLVKYGAIVMDTGSPDAYWYWHLESDLQYIVNAPPNTTGPWYNWALGLTSNLANDMTSENFFPGGDVKGVWDNNADGITDWTAAIWSHLDVQEECVSRPSGC